MQKKAISLALNAIVIAALALVVLVVMLTIFVEWASIFSKDELWPALEFPATRTSPISFVPLELEPGVKTRMTIGFYNNEEAKITPNIKPEITCDRIKNIQIETSGITVDQDDRGSYASLVTIPKGTMPDDYSCLMKISQTERSFFLKVLD